MYNALLSVIDIFARAGGGGSSSGGGGGVALLATIGYLPSYYLGKLIKKLLPRKEELIVSGIFAVFFSVVILLIGFAVNALGAYIALSIIAGIWAGWGAAFFGVWDRLRKRSEATKQEIVVAGQTDAVWNEQTLTEFSKTIFYQFQTDWSSMNLGSIARYLTPSYYRHNELLLQILRELKRVNAMTNVKLKNCLIIDIHDDVDNSKDTFTAAIEAEANDQLIDAASNTILFQDNSTFTEYWTFVRSGNTWMLDNIYQQTAELSDINKSIQDFAMKNHMFYSLDMGWLFLPRKGELFSKGGFGKSDINNHVVGTYNQHLVQLYTYVVDDSSANQMVAQIHLPKSYGGIIIRPIVNFLKLNLGRQVPQGYQKYDFEWPDFNKRYQVYATDADRLATFELLNPAFMAYLYDNDPGVAIEVTDNIVYLHKDAKEIDTAEYERYLTILLKAFRELKL